MIDSGSEIWDESDGEALADVEPPPLGSQNVCSSDQERKLMVLVNWIVIFLARMRSLFSLSDAACNFILKFLSIFLGLLGQIISPSHPIPKVPPSIYKLRQLLNTAGEFTRYVICRKCSNIYSLKDSRDRNGRSKKCQFVRFPDHPQRRMRQPCNTLLL